MSEKSRPVSREADSRESSEKPKVWQPPKRLPQFADLDPDRHFRWVRYQTLGEPDNANVLMRMREGYEPVRPEEVGLFNHPTVEDGKFEGAVVSGDLMLMSIHQDIVDQRNAYFAEQSKSLQRNVDQELAKEDDELTPISKSVKSGHTTGKPHFRED